MTKPTLSEFFATFQQPNAHALGTPERKLANKLLHKRNQILNLIEKQSDDFTAYYSAYSLDGRLNRLHALTGQGTHHILMDALDLLTYYTLTQKGLDEEALDIETLWLRGHSKLKTTK